MTNAPVNHVGMTVAIDDLPPLIWHAELGDKLQCLWSGSNHRGVQLNDLRQAVERWMLTYGQRCWLRQLTPYATREQEDELLRVIARMDGTAFPTTARLTGRWMRGRVPIVSDFTRGLPFVHRRVRESAERKKAEKPQRGLETAYCAETVAITYRGDGAADHREALQLVRPWQVLERRHPAVDAGLPAQRRDRRHSLTGNGVRGHNSPTNHAFLCMIRSADNHPRGRRTESLFYAVQITPYGVSTASAEAHP